MGNNSLSPRKTRAIRLSEFSRLDDQQGESSRARRPQSNAYFRSQASDLYLQKKFMAPISGSFPGAHVPGRCCIVLRCVCASHLSMDCAGEMRPAQRRRRRNERVKLQAGAQRNRRISVAGAAAGVGVFPSHTSKICVHSSAQSGGGTDLAALGISAAGSRSSFGFAQDALTPAPPVFTLNSIPTEIPRCARDFGSGLSPSLRSGSRPLSASSYLGAFFLSGGGTNFRAAELMQ